MANQNTKPLFYASVVFLRKCVQIKNDIPMRTNGIVGVIVIEGSQLKGVKTKMRGQILKIGCILATGIQAKRRVKSEVENKGYMYLCPK